VRLGEAADADFAIGAGARVAAANAGTIPVRGDLNELVRAPVPSRAAVAGIERNLFAAFAYNAVWTPLAPGFLYPVFWTRFSRWCRLRL
jgi:cation transport ATPase